MNPDIKPTTSICNYIMSCLKRLIIFAVATLANPITWSGNPSAKTSISYGSELVTLYQKGESSAQFLYSKNTNSSVSLVDVYLINEKENVSRVIQQKFNMIAQTCSCYWLNATEQLTGKIPSSRNYRIMFKNEEYEIKSGLFGLSWGSKFNDGEVDGILRQTSNDLPSVRPPPFAASNGNRNTFKGLAYLAPVVAMLLI